MSNHYFFTIMLRPYLWNFPIVPVHLSKSVSVHFSLKEVKDIDIIVNIINSHPKFEAK